jgi:hypothetical protein
MANWQWLIGNGLLAMANWQWLMTAGEANPLRSIDGAPAPVTHEDALGNTHMVVRDLDFPPATAPILPAMALQPIVDAMMTLGNASRQEKVAPATIWESGIASLYRVCQVPYDFGVPRFGFDSHLFYHIHGSCSRSPCPYNHRKHTAAKNAMLAA